MPAKAKNYATWIAGGSLVITLLILLFNGFGKAAVAQAQITTIDGRLGSIEESFREHDAESPETVRLLVRDETRGGEKERSELKKMVRENHDELLTLRADITYIKKALESR